MCKGINAKENDMERIEQFYAGVKADSILKECKLKKDFDGMDKRISALKKEYGVKPFRFSSKEVLSLK